MNRRNFFKNLGLIMGGLTVIPTKIFPIPNTIPKAIKKRKLKAVWTAELEQDLICYHGIMDIREL